MSGIIYFEGGPLDGKAYFSNAVWGGKDPLPGAELYQDGLRFRTSDKTNATARVWVLKDAPDPVVVHDPDEHHPEARHDLLRRREALKASRALLAERAGLAVSKVAAIENGTGKRIKAEEVQALANVLSQMELEQGQRGEVSAHS